MTDLTILFAQLNLRPIAYNSIYTKITGSLTAGVLLSQLIYWSSTRQPNQKEFYKTDAELMQETAMTLKELAGAKSRITKFVEISRKGVPAKTHYLVNELAIINEIISYTKTAQLDMTKQDNLLTQNSTTRYDKTEQHIYTENTTYNTTKITKENKENTTELEVQPKTPNSTQTLNINSLSNFFEFSQSEREDMSIYKTLTNLLVFFNQKHLTLSDLKAIKESVKPDIYSKNFLFKKNWGGWINDWEASKAAESIKQFTITKIETPEVLTLENIAMSKYSKEFQTIVWITEREDKGDINSKEAILEFLNKDNEIPNYSKYEHLANQLFSKLQIKI